jgi:BRCA1 C Terminus (BRCT) domain
MQLEGPKLLKAKEWGVPIVTVGWLWEVISKGSEVVGIGPWSVQSRGSLLILCFLHLELTRYSPEAITSRMKPMSANPSTCPPSETTGYRCILEGCVIYVSKQLEGRVSELHATAEKLGAKVTQKFNPAEVTHLIHQSSRMAETFREFRLAQSARIHIVHPQWLFECRSRGTRCGEDAWDWTWDGDRNLAIIGLIESNTAPQEMRREKRSRHDENTPPDQTEDIGDTVKVEQLTKLLGNISSPQKKSRRKLAGRARNTQISTTASSMTSSDAAFVINDEEDAPRPTQEKVEYKDPVAEREMAKIIANLQGNPEQDRITQLQSSVMTPAEDIGRRGGRRKSTRK